MIRKFLTDRRGNYALLSAVAIVPIMGGLALAIDYTEMTKQRQDTLNALDAAGIATARRIVEGASDTEAKAYAKQFFETNLGSVDPADTVLTVVLPQNNAGGGTLKLAAGLKYRPYFFPAFVKLLGKTQTADKVDFAATSEIRLKNTLEVALVLDNSGSMNELGKGSSKVRFDLLKSAAKELVTSLSGQAALMKQVNNPVRFAIVPFAASVNVGPDKYYTDKATWLDLDGASPLHHENFDWSTFTSTNKKVTLNGGIYYKTGSDWGTANGKKMTRFTLFEDMQRITGYHQEQTGTSCGWKNGVWKCSPVYADVPDYASYATWAGCVEARPYPYNIDDTTPASTTPATLFVPMFAPDETDNKNGWYGAKGNYWADGTTGTNLQRQKYMPKYYSAAAQGTAAATGEGGPNGSCTTKPITALTDVSTAAGKKKIEDAIDAMVANGATNVPEGMAWGWRAISHARPFTEGRSETEKGNDKVLIVLTDGANTYYTPESLGYEDLAGNKSIYSNYGYAGRWPTGYSTSRIFQGVPDSISKTDYSNGNYTKAMNAQFDSLCQKAKAANLIVMTVALDLDDKNSAEKAQIDALKACASDSRFRKDGTTGKAMKLFWNATGKSLSDDFKAIGNELSNLRIVG